jgi:hypothetical protein
MKSSDFKNNEIEIYEWPGIAGLNSNNSGLNSTKLL